MPQRDHVAAIRAAAAAEIAAHQRKVDAMREAREAGVPVDVIAQVALDGGAAATALELPAVLERRRSDRRTAERRRRG